MKHHRGRAVNPSDEVVGLNQVVSTRGGRTEIDVETIAEEIEVKAGDYSRQRGPNLAFRDRMTRKMAHARESGKTAVYYFEEGRISPEFIRKVEKRGPVVRVGIPWAHLRD